MVTRINKINRLYRMVTRSRQALISKLNKIFVGLINKETHIADALARFWLDQNKSNHGDQQINLKPNLWTRIIMQCKDRNRGARLPAHQLTKTWILLCRCIQKIHTYTSIHIKISARFKTLYSAKKNRPVAASRIIVLPPPEKPLGLRLAK